jgi:hypothetical protein
MSDWNEIHAGLKRLFPDLEADTTKGKIVRSCLHDGVAKIIFMRHGAEGERLAKEYNNAFRGNPLEGLKTFPEVAEEVLAIVEAYNLNLKKVPRIGTAELKQWFLEQHKKEVS